MMSDNYSQAPLKGKKKKMNSYYVFFFGCVQNNSCVLGKEK